MSISAFALIFLTIYVGIAQLDALSVKIGLFSPVFGGAVTGLVMGDLKTGLIVGATLQLATLGVATYGGATVPDFLSGSIMGSAFAIMSGRGAAYGIGLAIPIGLLLTQMDILARMTNTIFQHHADRLAEKGDYKGVERNNLYGIIPWTVSRMLPVFVGLFFGSAVVKAINAWIPAWLMVGLKTAGIILPAMGIAILMRYLPLKRYFPYFILGFVLMAYFTKTFSLLGTELVGFVFAALHVLDANDRKRNESNNHRPSNHNHGVSNGGDDSDEEVEIDV